MIHLPLVLHVKNTTKSKKTKTISVLSCMFILIISIVLVQSSLVIAQDQPAKLTGSITDQAVDTDNDGTYNELVIGVEINVTTQGTFGVEVFGLYDSSANYVEVSNTNSTYLNAGLHIVDVHLDGSIIYSSGLNLNKIAIIDLYDDSENEIDARYDLSLSKTYSFFEFQHVPATFSFDKVQNRIILDQENNILVTNIYSITNLGSWANSVNINFPENAYDFEVRDEMGTLEKTLDGNTMNISFRTVIFENETENIYLNYHLMREDYITQKNGNDFSLSFSFLEEFNSSIKTLTVYITLPKGAIYQSSSGLNPEKVEKIDLQDTIKFSFYDVLSSNDLDFLIQYKYNVFWGSFYPTLWVGILVIIVTVGFYFLGNPKTISTSSISIPTNEIRSFVDAYEEKTKAQSELKSLEERLNKGKVSRRRYKVRKKLLDSRLSSISRNLSTLRGTLRASGSKFKRLMNELEVAETKLEGTEKDIRRIKLRYSRGEISKNSYGNLLNEYQDRIEDAEGIIDGVLLRLRD